MAVSSSVLFGHAGGWDETLFVLAPIALFGALLYLANRRAARFEREEADEEAVSS